MSTAAQDGAMQEPGTVGALRRRGAVLAAILASALVLTVWLVRANTRATQQSDIAESALPAVIADDPARVWTSIQMRFSDAEMAILETNDYVYRTYTDGVGPPVDLCIVFSLDNRKGTHPPDVCLAGGGSRIDERQERTVAVAGDALDVREIVATSNGRSTYFLYFYKVGDRFTPSFYRQQGLILWYGLTGRNSAGALIRYSTPLADLRDLEQARARVMELLRATYPYLRAKLNPR